MWLHSVPSVPINPELVGSRVHPEEVAQHDDNLSAETRQQLAVASRRLFCAADRVPPERSRRDTPGRDTALSSRDCVPSIPGQNEGPFSY